MQTPNPAFERTWRVGVWVSRGGLPGAATRTDSSCNLRVRIDNRNSATPPFDTAQ